MAHTFYTGRAQKELDELDPKIKRQVVRAIRGIPSVHREQRRAKVKKIKGRRKGEPDLYRIRSGDYRILYMVNEAGEGEAQIIILHIRHRRDAYR